MNFGELKLRVIAECMRHSARASEPDFLTELPGWVALAESRIAYGAGNIPPLRVMAMQAAATPTLTNGSATLPADYIEATRVSVPFSGQSVAPRFEPPSDFHARRNTATSGIAATYTIEAGALLVNPRLSGTAELVYYAKPAALVTEAQTNWVLTEVHGLLFHGVLIDAMRWLGQPEREQAAIVAYTALIAATNRRSLDARHTGGPLYPRIRQ